MYAHVSSSPTPRIHGASRRGGNTFDCLAAIMTSAVVTALVNLIIQTEAELPTSGTTRNPSSQNITPKQTAEKIAQFTPKFFFAGCNCSSIGFASLGSCSPRATTTTPTIVNTRPERRNGVSRSPVNAESTIVSTG